MTNNLLINDVDAWTHGIVMGDGFVEELYKPFPMKDNITNESRLKHGKDVINIAKVDSMTHTFAFNIHGATPEEWARNYKWLMEQLQGGNVLIDVPPLEIYGVKLLYTGKSVNFNMSASGCSSTLSCAFDEPNPMERY